MHFARYCQLSFKNPFQVTNLIVSFPLGSTTTRAQLHVCNCSWPLRLPCCALLPSVVYSSTGRVKSSSDFVGETEIPNYDWSYVTFAPVQSIIFALKKKCPVRWQGLLAKLRFCNVLFLTMCFRFLGRGICIHLFL